MTDVRVRPLATTAAPPAAPSPPAADPFAERLRARPVLVCVPLYRRPDLAERVVASLIACADDLRAVDAEVVLYDDSPDDPSLAAALDALMPRAAAAFTVRRVANARNLGFVGVANLAMEEAVARGFDALLLNSDTVITPGALPEMARVALADPMIGFVNPRSNNATLATLPFQDRFRHLEPEPARAAWSTVSERLPAYSYAPTANGFCMWVRWLVLAEFGGFDPIYGLGYNEENDLVMRAGRRGWRALLANYAFVWHEGSASFGVEGHGLLEPRNRATLLARYPEYPGLTDAYFHSPEQRAELLLGALVPDEDGRLDVALDFSSFVAAHNGTFEAGVQLLAAAAVAWRGRFNLSVICAPDVYAFHGFGRHGVPRRDPYGPETFAAIFRVGQPYDDGAIERLVLKGATFGVSMLDTISLDCSALADPELVRLWGFTLEHADLISSISALSDAQLGRRLPFGPDVLRIVTPLSFDLNDYRLPRSPDAAPPAPEGYVFVVGNHYWHKDVGAAAHGLAQADPDRTVVVLAAAEGADPPLADEGVHAPRGLRAAPNILRLAAGKLTAERMGDLYAHAAAVVLPSHYEGFGIPVLNALAAKRPVFVRALPVFAEFLEALGGEPNIHVFQTTADLAALLDDPPTWIEAGASRGRPGDATRAAEAIGEAIDRAIARADYARIVRRIRFRRILAPPSAPITSPTAFVADVGARKVEGALRWTLELPGVFPALRFVVRGARFVLRGGRRRTVGPDEP